MKLKKTALLLLLAIAVISCNNKIPDSNGYTGITGIVDMPYVDEVTLLKVEHGESVQMATSKITKSNTFGFNIKPEHEGFYVLDTKVAKIPLYLKGNQQLNIIYNADGYVQNNIPDQENKILYNWVKLTDTLQNFDFLRRKNTTYVEFFPFYTKFIPEMEKQKEQVNTPNKHFNILMKKYIDVQIENTALSFLFTPRTIHPKKEQLALFYNDFMASDNLNTTAILDVPDGLKTLRIHQLFKATFKIENIPNKEKLTWMVNDVKNDTLRGYIAWQHLKVFKEYNENYLNFIEPLRNDIALSDYTKQKVDDFELTIKTMDPGTQGYPFTYKNQHGKEYKFSDFKGKVIYIDVWATWCAPCKQQIPYLKQLEKELHGKNIEFISISVDKPKDYEKWKKYVNNQQLTGVQLISEDAFNTSIAKDYKINAIPRFLLFDTEGKIVDANAKRPSDPELKKQLLSLLK
ncbi:MAG: TlpA family protein disulfide reductase [Aestuariibaculum sp.]